MKRRVAFMWIAAALFLSPALFAQSGTLTPEERSFLIEQLTKSKEGFLASIQGLTDAQWKYKATPDRWSIEECSEHIILAEDFIFDGSQKMLQAPAQPRGASSTPERDRELFAMVQDRSHKAAAPEPIRPTGQWPKVSDAIAEFSKRRDRNISYIRDTNDELRTHSSADTPMGILDAYQVIVILAGHSMRHTAQIQEVKTSPGYPHTTAKNDPAAHPQNFPAGGNGPHNMRNYFVAHVLDDPDGNQPLSTGRRRSEVLTIC